jgi:putative acetyltransferase
VRSAAKAARGPAPPGTPLRYNLSIMLRIFQAEMPEHYAAARELLEEYAAELGHDLHFQQFPYELVSLPGAYAPPRGRLLLATSDGALAGCVALRAQSSTVCEMKRMYVRPEFRRQGIGRRLAIDVTEAARQIGYERMRLDTLDTMSIPRALYRSLGFQEVPAYYHNPIPGAVFLELDLRPGFPGA